MGDYMFNAKKEVNNIVKFIREYYEKNHLSGCVLGISGGKDSAVVSALMVRALGKENVIGITLPCHSNLLDMKDAKKISEYYGFKLLNIDLTNVFDNFKEEILKLGKYSEENYINSDINLKPRLRMASLYYMAALLSSINKKNYLVAGTSNKCELFVGYFTKGGDNVCDISPIGDYTVSEVIKIGEELKVPEEVLYKTPSDGLSNLSDEDKLGVTYKDIEAYMDGKVLDKEAKNKIERLHNGCSHKFNTPMYKRNNQ